MVERGTRREFYRLILIALFILGGSALATQRAYASVTLDDGAGFCWFDNTIPQNGTLNGRPFFQEVGPSTSIDFVRWNGSIWEAGRTLTSSGVEEIFHTSTGNTASPPCSANFSWSLGAAGQAFSCGTLTLTGECSSTVPPNVAPTINSNNSASVAENQTSAIDVQATDDSDSEGSGLTFSLSGGADQSRFSIAFGNGVVTFNDTPDFEIPGDAGSDNVYNIQVTVTDSGALTAVQNIEITVTDVDEIAPTASPTLNPTPNAAGWNTADVTVTWNWADNAGGSGINTGNCTTSSTSSGEGTINVGATCVDLAGNVGNANVTVNVDKTAPTASPVLAPTPNAAGWNNSDVTVTWNWADGGSGLDSANCNPSNIAIQQGPNVIALGVCQDIADNLTQTPVFLNIDKGNPDTSFDQTPPTNATVDTATFTFFGTDSIDASPNFECQLDGAGFAACTSPVNLTGLSNDSHTYDVRTIDQAGNIDPTPASYTWTVTLNEAPVAADDAFSVVANGTLNISAPGVLGNDTDPENDSLMAIQVSPPAQGSLSLNTDGSFVYTAPSAFSGPDSFTYQANDGSSNSNTATVTIDDQQIVCGGSNNLTAGTWRMVSLPCVPPDATVAGVWADDLDGVFDTNWKVFSYDAANTQYQQHALADAVTQSTGYWVRHTGDQTWNVLGTPTPVVSRTTNPLCPSVAGCFEIDLVEPATATDLFNLVGNPFAQPIDWSSVRVQDVGAGVVYSPSQANEIAINIMSNTRWTYSGANYVACNDTGSPVQCDDMTATPAVGLYEGFWIKLLPGAFGKALKLLIPLAP